MKSVVIFCLCISGLLAESTVHFKEEFLDEKWTDRWTESTFKGAEQGKFTWSAGKYFSDPVKAKGIQTSQDAKFYGISAKFEKPISNEGKTLVVQFQVKHEQSIDCGGGYIKVMGSDIDQKQFQGETPYHIMFGPDICGMSTKKVHVIFNYKGKNLLIKKDIRCRDDEFSHLYTLILRADNTYEVLIDNEKAESGTLEEDWDFLAPKKIKDPSAKKPEDWDDREKIDDPADVKPDDWEKPKTIPDPNAKKPEDWDDEMDGEWEPPQIDNPEYKGDWKPKQIDNPSYKGVWVHPEIDNPDYQPDSNLYLYKDIGSVGIDLWQVKSGSVFDNLMITDDPEVAKKFGEETWKPEMEAEKKKKEAADEEQRQKDKEEEDKRKAEAKPETKEEKEDDDDDEKAKKDTASKDEKKEEKELKDEL